MAVKRKPIAFFDVDGTVLKGSIGMMVATYLFRLGVLDVYHIARASYYAGKHYLNRVDERKMFGEAVRLFKGFKEDELKQICLQIFEQVTKKNIYRGSVKLIEHHKQRNEPVVIISSGPRYVIEYLADYLVVEDSITSAAVVQDGVFTDILEEPICYGEGKRILAEQYVQDKGISLSDCFFYSDSSSDLPLLEAVGFPKIVNPDLKLELRARLKGWEIFRFRDTLSTAYNPLW
jgi:putative phosphoserine phosphatase / 1-acylglycerol-3-phosphate O-acyltransferase